MSTSCTIAMQNANGTISAIYVHWDGYPDGVGQTLLDSYNTAERIAELVSLGNVSSLGNTIASTRFYARDMGRTEQSAKIYTCNPANVNWGQGDYNYIWLDNSWKIWDNFTDDAQGDLLPLSDFV